MLEWRKSGSKLYIRHDDGEIKSFLLGPKIDALGVCNYGMLSYFVAQCGRGLTSYEYCSGKLSSAMPISIKSSSFLLAEQVTIDEEETHHHRPALLVPDQYGLFATLHTVSVKHRGNISIDSTEMDFVVPAKMKAARVLGTGCF